jgi:hypothetical protein
MTVRGNAKARGQRTRASSTRPARKAAILGAVSAYRDSLEAATRRISSLEATVAHHEDHLADLRQAVVVRDEELARLRDRAARPRDRRLGMLGAAVFVSGLAAGAIATWGSWRAEHDGGPPEIGQHITPYGPPSSRPHRLRTPERLLADPIGVQGERSRHLADPLAEGASAAVFTADEAPRCRREAMLDRKAKLLVRLAAGQAGDGEIGELNTTCVLEGDLACQELVMRAVEARGVPAPSSP